MGNHSLEMREEVLEMGVLGKGEVRTAERMST